MDYFEEVHVAAELNPGSIEEWLSIIQQGKKIDKGTKRSELSTKVKKHLSAIGWCFWYVHKGKRRELRYKSPKGKWFYSLATACMSCIDQISRKREEEEEIVPESVVSCSPRKQKRNRVEEDTCSVFDESNQKKKKKGCETAAFKEKASSFKIVVNIEISNKQQRKRMKKMTDEFHSLTPNEEEETKQRMVKSLKKETDWFNSLAPKEEAKGEMKPRMVKSLKNILQVMEKKNEKEEKESLRFLRKDCGPEMNCDVCCVCHWGGDLLLCDGCPSAFHHSCLGLSNLPNEDLWFCPCCCCNICGSMESPRNSKLMSCEQCLNRFHLKCLKEEDSCLVSPRGWFCSRQCSRVFSSLESLIGCKVEVGEEDLIWTLMRAPNDGEHYDDSQLKKLNSAVEILHQGFEPTKDPFTGKDLVEELIFRRDSNGVGRGFYTVLIERKNQPITVAAIRVDKDVVEIPLVSTLSNYRRSGMCRVLMDELEKQMSKIGVCKLVLPAATDVLETWTQRFGFSVMANEERLKLVKHGMLDFDGTVMCHKFLLEREGYSSLTT